MFLIVALAAVTAWSNDGVFCVNGNHLVPVQETDIALTREVLTISLGDDGYASVDVQYELNNSGRELTGILYGVFLLLVTAEMGLSRYGEKRPSRSRGKSGR